MENIWEIAISKIADSMSNGKLVTPRYDCWKIIFNNAGLQDDYEAIKNQLKEVQYELGYDINYKNNERSYSALYKKLNSLINSNPELFLRLLRSYLEKVNKYSVFNELVICDNKFNDLEHYFLKRGKVYANDFLSKNPSKDFLKLRNNLNILCYDIEFDASFELVIYPLTLINKNKQQNLMLEWLDLKYPNISNLFLKAVKMFGEGNSIECICNCRSVLTGIFSFDKVEKTKWLTGLQKACSLDKNIQSIDTPSKIIGFKSNSPHSDKKDERYNYPRFKTINQIYSFLSDLGPHISEGAKLHDVIDCEECTVQDAFLGLQLTESILIWIYQNKIEIE